MALRRIALRDFVIVPALELDFATGFTALTGETGAGKSILIDALQLALGARGDAGVVREGAARAEITVEFDLPESLHPWLQEADVDTNDGVLLLRRTIDQQGKSRTWINGTPSTLTQVKTLGEQLLDIHGQHAWQSLMRPDAVRQLLDAYAQADASEVHNRWVRWRNAQVALEAARHQSDTLLRERERLQWQIGELEKLSPTVEGWEELNTQHNRLSHAHTLLETAQLALAQLDEDENSSASLLARAQDALQDQAHLEPEFATLCDTLATALAHVQDATRSLQGYLRNADIDPERLAELDTLMADWLRMARRYKRTPEQLPALLQGWREELQALDAATDLEQLQREEALCASAYHSAAQELSALRTKAAPKLSRSVTAAMQDLGMKGGQFEVRLQPLAQPGAWGLDDVQFLFSGHPGATPRPIGKIASGGELSRLSLAIAVTTSALGAAPTLIFDEVDSGVGGAVAESVGQLMRQLGTQRQVLAVTHLPQVAACAHQHLVVSKTRSAQGTASRVEPVEGEARQHEIARMLGGQRISATTLAHAAEMLQAAAAASPVS